jgi:hypothetical protein
MILILGKFKLFYWIFWWLSGNVDCNVSHCKRPRSLLENLDYTTLHQGYDFDYNPKCNLDAPLRNQGFLKKSQ